MVRKKSAGVGRLNFQRCAYSRNAKSKSSRPMTVSRSTVSAAAGLRVGIRAPRRSTESDWVMTGTWFGEVMYSGIMSSTLVSVTRLSERRLKAGKSSSHSSSATYCRNVFRPSSIQVHWRSSEFTVMGK
jgi:hypothetical protein